MDSETEERIKRLEVMQEKNQILSGQILESILRLERIVVANSTNIIEKEIENKEN